MILNSGLTYFTSLDTSLPFDAQFRQSAPGRTRFLPHFGHTVQKLLYAVTTLSIASSIGIPEDILSMKSTAELKSAVTAYVARAISVFSPFFFTASRKALPYMRFIVRLSISLYGTQIAEISPPPSRLTAIMRSLVNSASD